MTDYAIPTETQRVGNNALFSRSLTKAQAAAVRDWVDGTEMSAAEHLALQRRLRAASTIAREQLGEQAA